MTGGRLKGKSSSSTAHDNDYYLHIDSSVAAPRMEGIVVQPSKRPNCHVIQPMDKLLASEIQKYELIYNNLSSKYKDAKMTEIAWKKIGQEMDLTPYECKRRWKNMRDRYVRMRKTMGHGVPEIFECFSFLNPYIKHKDIESEKKKRRASTESGCAKKQKASDDVISIIVVDEEEKLASPQANELNFMDPLRLAPKEKTESNHEETSSYSIEGNNLMKDSVGRFAISMSDLFRALPKSRRSNAMLDVHKVLNAYINDQNIEIKIV